MKVRERGHELYKEERDEERETRKKFLALLVSTHFYALNGLTKNKEGIKRAKCVSKK